MRGSALLASANSRLLTKKFVTCLKKKRKSIKSSKLKYYNTSSPVTFKTYLVFIFYALMLWCVKNIEKVRAYLIEPDSIDRPCFSFRESHLTFESKGLINFK